MDYRAKLVERHAHMPQVKRLVRRRNLPKMVKKMRIAGTRTGSGGARSYSGRWTTRGPGPSCPRRRAARSWCGRCPKVTVCFFLRVCGARVSWRLKTGFASMACLLRILAAPLCSAGGPGYEGA